MQMWSTETLQRHVLMLQDALKKGVNDPDADARLLARKYVPLTALSACHLTHNTKTLLLATA